MLMLTLTGKRKFCQLNINCKALRILFGKNEIAAQSNIKHISSKKG